MAYRPGGASVQGQTLDVTVAGCYNLKDTEWFSRQDPYVVLEYSGQKFRTRTDTDGGKNPSFNETFKFALIEGLQEMSATVWNSNIINRDYYIGSTKILLSKVIESGYDDTQWSLTDARSRKSSGTLKLILHYIKPGGMSYPQAAPPASAGYYGPAPAAYPPAVPAYGPAPPYGQQQPACSYPPAPMYQAAPPVTYPPAPMAAYGAPPPAPMYQAAPPVTYPPAPMAAYGAPPPAQPSYYPAQAPAYGAPSAPPYQAYPPAGYGPSAYPPYR